MRSAWPEIIKLRPKVNKRERKKTIQRNQPTTSWFSEKRNKMKAPSHSNWKSSKNIQINKPKNKREEEKADTSKSKESLDFYFQNLHSTKLENLIKEMGIFLYRYHFSKFHHTLAGHYRPKLQYRNLHNILGMSDFRKNTMQIMSPVPLQFPLLLYFSLKSRDHLVPEREVNITRERKWDRLKHTQAGYCSFPHTWSCSPQTLGYELMDCQQLKPQSFTYNKQTLTWFKKPMNLIQLFHCTEWLKETRILTIK